MTTLTYDKDLSAIVTIDDHRVKLVADFGKSDYQNLGQLMATSQELLDALELLYDHCRLYHPDVERNNVGQAVRNVVAKAKGH